MATATRITSVCCCPLRLVRARDRTNILCSRYDLHCTEIQTSSPLNPYPMGILYILTNTIRCTDPLSQGECAKNIVIQFVNVVHTKKERICHSRLARLGCRARAQSKLATDRQTFGTNLSKRNYQCITHNITLFFSIFIFCFCFSTVERNLFDTCRTYSFIPSPAPGQSCTNATRIEDKLYEHREVNISSHIHIQI